MAVYTGGNKSNRQVGKNYLFVISIGNYKDPDIDNLPNAVSDGESIIKVLTEDYGFELFDKLLNVYATHDAIIKVLEKLENKLMSGDDNLIIFFAGHGYRKGQEGFIVPYDTQHDSTARYFNYPDLNARINLIKMRHFIFILDCCYAGSALNREVIQEREINRPSRYILAATYAEELAKDGFMGKNSPFTAALVEVLDENTSEKLLFKKLFTSIRDLMESRGGQLPIEGKWQMSTNGTGEFAFVRKDIGKKDWNNVDTASTKSLQLFMKKYDSGVFYEKAKTSLLEIEQNNKSMAEKNAFDKVREKPNLRLLNQFLKNYPKGDFEEDAKKLLRALKLEESDWNKIKDLGELKDFEVFRDTHKAGKYFKKCEERIISLKKNPARFVTFVPVIPKFKPFKMEVFLAFVKSNLKLLTALTISFFMIFLALFIVRQCVTPPKIKVESENLVQLAASEILPSTTTQPSTLEVKSAGNVSSEVEKKTKLNQKRETTPQIKQLEIESIPLKIYLDSAFKKLDIDGNEAVKIINKAISLKKLDKEQQFKLERIILNINSSELDSAKDLIKRF
jgi:hypothetical protein